MKHFVGHEPCPKCGSRNNVGVWSDGQKYCFSGCGYGIAGYTAMSVKDIKQHLDYQDRAKKKKNNVHLALPVDFTNALPLAPLTWCIKYGISHLERIKFGIGWSPSYEALILPAYDIQGNLLLYQRRYFGTMNFPKYITRGFPDSVIWTVDGDPKRTDRIVVVEDMISAIKVGRVANSMCLWGSQLSSHRIRQLSNLYSELVIWLDRNKAEEAVKFRLKALPFFNNVRVIISDLDPKEYDNASIAAFIAAA